MPYVRIWRFRPAPGRTIEFEAAYGGDGDWARLFRRGDGYLGTQLLPPAENTAHYLTLDQWRDAADWQSFLEKHGAEYRALDARLGPLCAEEAEIGSFHTP